MASEAMWSKYIHISVDRSIAIGGSVAVVAFVVVVVVVVVVGGL